MKLADQVAVITDGANGIGGATRGPDAGARALDRRNEDMRGANT